MTGNFQVTDTGRAFSLSRRGVIGCATAMLMLAHVRKLRAATSTDPREAIRDAFLFGFPVYEMVRTKYRAYRRALDVGRPAINFLAHRRVLADHRHRNVTTPNNDTLYAGGWLDLRDGPVAVTIPPLDRYHSLALLDLSTDNFAVLRHDPEEGGRYLIVGPEWRGPFPEDRAIVRARTNDVWAIWRVLVRGTDDLDAALSAQTRIALAPVGERTAQTDWDMPLPVDSRDPENLLAIFNAALARAPLPSGWIDRLAPLAHVGLDPRGAGFGGLDGELQVMWRTLLPQLHDEISGGIAATGTSDRGWLYPAPGMGDFGEDDLYRARVALGGLGALPREEAIYISSTEDAGGVALDGERRYRLRLPRDIPVDAFWSMSMYRIEPGGRLFFVENPLDRYAIGSFTPGAGNTGEGPIDIRIQTDQPADANSLWLPAPDGPFRLVFRAYRPRGTLLDGGFRLPAIEPLMPS
ncbi:DUF1254 domain-containing protein [Parasphingopyxis sp.]|uniref:DUF1254 domain-containing protein n=1 Tax=Parasphingopyxis sp. TaxID=1920299 RepID=UPI00261D90EE|nr:DUF1254 domain-containing protein [Parasphingopyxis sp.]